MDLLDQVPDGSDAHLLLIAAHEGHLELNDQPVVNVERSNALFNHPLLSLSKLVLAEMVDDLFVLPVFINIELLRG